MKSFRHQLHKTRFVTFLPTATIPAPGTREHGTAFVSAENGTGVWLLVAGNDIGEEIPFDAIPAPIRTIMERHITTNTTDTNNQ